MAESHIENEAIVRSHKPGLNVQGRREIFELSKVLSYHYMRHLDQRLHDGNYLLDKENLEVNASVAALWLIVRNQYISFVEQEGFSYFHNLDSAHGHHQPGYAAYQRYQQLEKEGWFTDPEISIDSQLNFVFPVLNVVTDMCLEIIESIPQLVDQKMGTASAQEKIAAVYSILYQNPKIIKNLAAVHDDNFRYVREMFGLKLNAHLLVLKEGHNGLELEWQPTIKQRLLQELKLTTALWATENGLGYALGCPALQKGDSGESGIDILWRTLRKMIESNHTIEKIYRLSR